MLHCLSSASDRGTQIVAKQRPRNVRCIIDNRYIGSFALTAPSFYCPPPFRIILQDASSIRNLQPCCQSVATPCGHNVATPCDQKWPQLCGQNFVRRKQTWPQIVATKWHTFWICLARNANVVATLWPQLVATFGLSVSAVGVRGETWARKS